MAAGGNELSDDELHRRLLEIGVTNCPVTASTRKILLKKYGREIMSESKVSKPRNNQRSPIQLGFSSDEGEDFENSPKRTPPNHRFRRKSTASDLNPKSSRRLSSPVSTDFKKPSSPPRRSSRKSLVPKSSNSIAAGDANGDVDRRRRTRSSSNKVNMLFDMDISDSDNDLHSHHSPHDLWTRKNDKLNSSASQSFDNETNDIFMNERPASTSGLQTSILNHKKVVTKKYEPDEEEQRTEIPNDINNEKDFYDHYYSNKHEKVRALFASEGKSDSLSRNHHHPHTISTFLLVIAVVFFVAVGIFYVVGMKQWNISDIINNNFFMPSDIKHQYLNITTNLTETEKCDSSLCARSDYFEVVLKYSQALIEELSILAGKYECNEMVHYRNITKRQALDFIETLDIKKGQYSLKMILNDVLSVFIKNKEKMKISLFSSDGKGGLYFPEEVWWLQSNYPIKSISCRLKLAALSVIWKLLSITCVIILCFCGYKFYVFRKLQQEEHKNKVFDLAEEIIGIIKKYHMQYQDMKGSHEQCYIPVTHVRDMLIPLTDRVEMRRIWDDACKIVEDHESRVRVEYQTVAGEDHKVWRWLENSINGESNSKVWQGRAFENDVSGINALSYSVTPCLKIRNMFSPDKEKDGGWETSVIDAVMEKCGDSHQIVHIAIANDSSIPEGCVYVKYKDNAAAGQAYRALHGCWFDGKLVTVKFLRLERYHEHYPEAVGLTTPLKPSNSLKLSLLHDSLSSSNEVLERS